MKKYVGYFGLALMLACSIAVGAGYDTKLEQRNINDTLWQTRLVPKPPGTENGLFGYLGGTDQRPTMYRIGDGLAIQSGVLVSTVPAGPAGPQGATGPIGPQGPEGLKGDAGATGAQGIQGPQGIPGATGVSGAKGDKGDTGAAGATGSQGPIGLTGPAGPSGGTGLTGAQGPVGAKGDTGSQGPQGVKGDTGATGATGPQGPSGISKRIETYTGTTNAAGQVVVTYLAPFAQTPNVQPPAPALASQVWTTVSSSATGFTLQLNQRNAVTLLGIEVLLGATVPVASTAVQIVVIER